MNWRLSKDGEFTMATAYNLMRAEEEQVSEFKGRWIWKIDTLPRICHFLWLCHHNSVPVRGVVAARGIDCDVLCPLCKNEEESIIHLLRDCPFARYLWGQLGIPGSLSSSFGAELQNWLQTNCMCHPLIKAHGYPWKMLFPFAIWTLWKHRNRIVFENTTINPKLHESCLKQTIDYLYCVAKSFRTKQMGSVQVRWYKPFEGWYKLNTDGASFGNPGKAGAGGVIRDLEGTWIRGFCRSIGVTTSVMAEFWALRDGLTLAFQLGLPCLEVELDAKIVVDLVLSSTVTNRDYSSFLNDCRYLLQKFQQVRVKHIFWEVNRCADGLAKRGCLQQEDFVILLSPPSPEFVSFVCMDAAGQYVLRQSACTLPVVAS